MRVFVGISILVLSLTACQTETEQDCTCPECPEVVEETWEYDSLYAAELGADEYGMKLYTMALLKEGPNRDRDSAEAAELQRAHMDNINRMAEEGKLVLAGPFGKNEGNIRGVYIFDATLEEAEELTSSDPAVQAGSLIMELIPWYGSAAVMEINKIHKKAAKTPI